MEVDLIADHSDSLLPVEIKSGATVASDWVSNIQKWSELAGSMSEKPWIVYGGDRNQRRSGVEIISWKNIAGLIKKV